MVVAAITAGQKYGILGALVGWLVAAVIMLTQDPDSPDYASMGLPCSPWLTKWGEDGSAVIRVPDQSGVDAVDVTFPAAWLKATFPGNPELVGIRDSGIVAWVPGSSSPVQATLISVCPWLAAWEGTHLAAWHGYQVPGWGVGELPAAVEWVRLFHAHPFNYEGPHNAAQLILAVRRLAFFHARDGSAFANWLRDLLFEKLAGEGEQFARWRWAAVVLADSMHRLGIQWDAPVGAAASARDRAIARVRQVASGSQTSPEPLLSILRDGPISPRASYDGRNHWPTHGAGPHPARGFARAWAVVP